MIRALRIAAITLTAAACGASTGESKLGPSSAPEPTGSNSGPAARTEPPRAAERAPASPAAKDDSECQSGNAGACFRLAERAIAAKDHGAAFTHFVRACDTGHGLACVHLGQSVEPDRGKRPEWLHKGFTLFERACTGGDAQGCYQLGIALERGLGTPVDLVRSLASYRKGCAQGNLEACSNEAGMYLTGKGTRQDIPRAAALYTSACERGDGHACYWLGRIHEQELGMAGDQSHIRKLQAPKLGVEARILDAKQLPRPSPAKRGPAIDLLFKNVSVAKLDEGCRAKRALDCYRLGVMYQVGGPDAKKDDAKAAHHYESACSAGSGWGCIRAGDCYERGYGVTPDFGKSSRLYLKVCSNGAPENQGFEQECAELGERLGM